MGHLIKQLRDARLSDGNASSGGSDLASAAELVGAPCVYGETDLVQTSLCITFDPKGDAITGTKSGDIQFFRGTKLWKIERGRWQCDHKQWNATTKACESKNKMSLRNITLVVAPNLFGKASGVAAVNPMEELQRCELATTVLFRLAQAVEESV